MANFKTHPGMFLKCIKDSHPFKQGDKYQILSIPGIHCSGWTFVGIDGVFDRWKGLDGNNLVPMWHVEIDKDEELK